MDRTVDEREEEIKSVHQKLNNQADQVEQSKKLKLKP